MKPRAGAFLALGLMTLAACTTPTNVAGLSENSLSGGAPRQVVVPAGAASKPPITDVIGGSPSPAASVAASAAPASADPNATASASASPDGASPSPSASPTPPEGIAATATPTTTGLEVAAREAADRPAALVNYDSGEIIWVPGEPLLKWSVKARTAVTFKKIELRLGAEASAVYRLAQAAESASPEASTSPTPETSAVPSAVGTLDVSFIPSPEVSPSPSPSPAVGGKPGLSQTHEIPLAAIGAPDSLVTGTGAELFLRPNGQVVESYIRQVKPLNLVYVSIALFDAEGKPVLDGTEPVVLTGQFLVK